MKAILLFAALILGGLTALILAIILIEPSCSGEIEGGNKEPNRGQQQQHGPNEYKGSSNQIATAICALDTKAEKNESAHTKGSHDWYEKGWWKKFLCDAKVGDFLLVYFTYCLVIVGAFQSFFLWKAAVESNALVRLEGARVLFSHVALRDGQTVESVEHGVRSPIRQEPRISLVYKNCGRSPGTLIDVAARLLLAPPKSHRGLFVFEKIEKLTAQLFMPEEGGTEHFDFEFELSEYSAAYLHKSLVVVAQLQYEDMSGQRRITRQCFQMIGQGKFARYGDEKYNNTK